MARTERFMFLNQPNKIIEDAKKWVRDNPRLATRTEEDQDYFYIEVFCTSDHAEKARELYRSLLTSGYLKSNPLFSIKVEFM
jgi:hypothetical protein